MTDKYDPALLAQEMSGVSPLVTEAFYSGNEDGTEVFILTVEKRLTTDEMVSICRDMAAIIRREIPEKEDGWAASIDADQYPRETMGVYFIGWAGRADRWHLFEGQERKETDAADWLALRERLRIALTALGTEGDERDVGGDFYFESGETFPHTQIVFVKRPEFLTKELIAVAQNVLKDGYDDWMVDLTLAFPPPFDVLLRGIEIRTNGISEMWDRQQVERLLGDRLKI
jgi:hypothetical protein